MTKKILFIFILIISVFLISNFIIPKSLPSKSDITAVSTVNVVPKTKPPIFITPPVIESSFCSGSICLPPGDSPASLNFNYLSSNNGSRDFGSTTIENKMGTASHEGNYHIPVFLVNFPDLHQPNEMTSDVYNDIFNSSNYLDGEGISVKEFYNHNSYGSLDITYDIYDWREVPQNYDFYIANTHQLVVDTMNLFGTGSNPIDFTQYDYNGDGRIDGVVIVHAGLGDQDVSGENIVTKTIIYKINPSTIQGMLYGDAAILPANQGPGPLTSCNSWLNSYDYPEDCRLSIETAVHEFAHVLGLPDLYAINYTGSQVGQGDLGYGLGGHTVMVANSGISQDPKKPVNFDPWSKYFFNWIHPNVVEDVSMSGIYSLGPFDTTDDAYILHNPNTMGDREFYLIVNRYTGEDSLDYYLFGKYMPTLLNFAGGIDILHVDENYIDYTYSGPIAFNSIMYDPDYDYYLDNTSHPGIRIEQNSLDAYDLAIRSSKDFYTGEVYIQDGCLENVYSGIFDNIQRIDPSDDCLILHDVTSLTYNGLVDNGVRVRGISDSAENVTGFFAVTTDPIAYIPSPVETHSYPYKELVDFNAGYFNTQGNVSCEWSYNGETISDECNFSATPFDLGLSSFNSVKSPIESIPKLNAHSSEEIPLIVSSADYKITNKIENKFSPNIIFSIVNFNNFNLKNSVANNELLFVVSKDNTVHLVKTVDYSETPNQIISDQKEVSSRLRSYPSNLIKEITLTVTDDNGSYTTSVELNVCLCLTMSNNQYLPD